MRKIFVLSIILGALLAPLATAASWAAGGDPALQAALETAIGQWQAAHRAGGTFWQLDPPHQTRDSAYAVAYARDVLSGERLPREFLVLLARRGAGGHWSVLVPETSSPSAYNSVLESLPAGLLDPATRLLLRQPESSATVDNFSGHRLPWPAGQIGYVTQKDGTYHQSQVDFDILGWAGDGAVYASRPGTVVFVKESSNSGCCDLNCWQQANMVVVQHAAEEYSWYVHLAPGSVPVTVGQTIDLGTRVGVEGETGYSCGVHLHYMASTGHYAWTDPLDPYAAPWATGITAVDFDEVTWASMVVGLSYVSQNEPSSYLITGLVTDSLDQGLAGVTVTAGSGLETSTDEYGAFVFSDLPAGSYTLAVEHRNSFDPDSQTLILPPDRSGVDFVADPLDLSIDAVTLLPAVNGQPLVAGKSLGVQVTVRKSGTGSVSDVPLQLTDGSATLTRFYVLAPGNLSGNGAPMLDNRWYPLDLAAGQVTATVLFVGLAPASPGSYQVTATVDPAGLLIETNTTNNNRASAAAAVSATEWGALDPALTLTYTPLDWGDEPLSRHGAYALAASELLRGAWPLAADDLLPFAGTTGVGSSAYRGGDGRLNVYELQSWLLATAPLLRLAAPEADRLVVTAPGGWFSSTTTCPELCNLAGLALREADLALVEARPDSLPNGPGAAQVAHQLGHTFGLPAGLPDGCSEEYLSCNPGRLDENGELAAAGFWPARRLAIEPTPAEPVYSLMSGPAGEAYWSDTDDYAALLAAQAVRTTQVTGPAIVAAGLVGISGTATLTDWFTLPEAEWSALRPGPYRFELRDASNGLLASHDFDLTFELEGGLALTSAPFVLTLPYPAGVARVDLFEGESLLGSKAVSAHAPVVTLSAPAGGEQLSGDETLTITWSGSDADGDTLRYVLFFSANDGEHWQLLAGPLTSTSYIWNLADLAAGSRYRVRVLATDGFLSDHDETAAAFSIWRDSYLPAMIHP